MQKTGWQAILNNFKKYTEGTIAALAKNTVCLWFNGDAEEAAQFYANAKEKHRLLSNFEENNAELRQKLSESEKELKIGKSDLQLMQKIWSHWLLVPASDLQIGTKGMVRIYSPQKCKDGNEISRLLRLPSVDCSYEKHLPPLRK